MMVEARFAEQIDHRSAGARFRIVRAEHHARDARVQHRAGAHRARLQRREELAAGQPIVAERRAPRRATPRSRRAPSGRCRRSAHCRRGRSSRRRARRSRRPALRRAQPRRARARAPRPSTLTAVRLIRHRRRSPRRPRSRPGSPGAMSFATSTMVHAGRMCAERLAVRAATSSHCAMSVTKMRVRTTSSRRAPARSSAALDVRDDLPVCAYGSPMPTMPPARRSPSCRTRRRDRPTRTARE